MPNQSSGVIVGFQAYFLAYIGFDVVSTLAEESKNPQRDLPRGMIRLNSLFAPLFYYSC
jgi:amino acid transporter